MKLKDQIAIVVGAGQTPGQSIGNGRATALLFAEHGAKVVLVDTDLNSAQQTLDQIKAKGGEGIALQCDIRDEAQCKNISDTTIAHYGRIDILHNNVGIGSGDAGPTSLTADNWDNIFNVNLRGMFLTCKYVLPHMRAQKSGSIVNISSVAAVASTNLLAYKTSKAGVNALTENLAMGGAKYGIRVNCIMPGLMNTPMAIEGHSQARGVDAEQLITARDKMVPLRKKMGSAWDIAKAALFLASDDASFITGVVLPVDGGQCLKVG